MNLDWRLGQRKIDNASGVVFRVAFGMVLATWCWDYLTLNRVQQYYIEPKFNFTYYCFDFLKPLPGNGMILHFLALLVLSISVAFGFAYRLSSLFLALGFTYVFLLDRTNYQNHYYLIFLIAWWLPFLPLHRNHSVDAYLFPKSRGDDYPAWVLWALRFHIGIPYFFGGIAKLNPDWLLCEPMRQMLASKSNMPIVGELFLNEFVVVAFSWGGLFFDLLIVPLLLWKRSRTGAYLACVVFHLLNSVLFNIHVFPWFMILATTVFFEPDWPRRLLGGSPITILQNDAFPQSFRALTLQQKLFVLLIALYVSLQTLIPLRHLLYVGDTSWTERGHHFAWRMMLRGKVVVLGFAVKDRVTKKVTDGNVRRFLNQEQSEKFGKDPELVLHFAHFLAEQHTRDTGNEASVYVLVLASLNGRKPQLMIDPNVDLAAEPRGFYRREWIVELTEPLRIPAWNVPIDQWRANVEIPPLQFLDNP